MGWGCVDLWYYGVDGLIWENGKRNCCFLNDDSDAAPAALYCVGYCSGRVKQNQLFVRDEINNQNQMILGQL